MLLVLRVLFGLMFCLAFVSRWVSRVQHGVRQG